MSVNSSTVYRFFPIALHSAVLVILMALSFFVSYAVKGKIVPPTFFFGQVWQGLAINVIFFYVCYGLLVVKRPKQRWRRYGLLVLLWGSTIALMVWFDVFRLKDYGYVITTNHYYYFVLVNTVVKSVFGVSALLTWAVISLVQQKLRYSQLELNTLQTQLSLLKSQTNPHFLFNTLTALYSKAYTQQQHELAEAIGQLSSLMRYTLMHSDKQFVLLEDEIDHLEAYIALQTLRTRQTCPINFSYGPIAGGVKIPPMLLNPLVENAVKYGVAEQFQSVIDISLACEQQQLIFVVSNHDLSEQVKRSATYQPSGLGLENLHQRLALLFDDQYTLTATSENGIYRARLIIPCL